MLLLGCVHAHTTRSRAVSHFGEGGRERASGDSRSVGEGSKGPLHMLALKESHYMVTNRDRLESIYSQKNSYLNLLLTWMDKSTCNSDASGDHIISGDPLHVPSSDKQTCCVNISVCRSGVGRAQGGGVRPPMLHAIKT